MPREFQGFWAHPECSDYAEGIILTGRFYLKSTEEKTIFRIAGLIAEKQDYRIIEIGAKKHPVLRTEDSVLRIGTMGGGGWAETWDDLPLLGRNEYTGCSDAPSVVPVPLVRMMAHIDRLHAACAAGSTKEACGRLVFELADTNGNKRLSMAEFKKLGAMVQTFAPLTVRDSVSTEDLEAAYRQGIGDGQEMAELLLKTRDRDHSGDLSLQELDGFMEADVTPATTSAQETLSTLFPLLNN